MPGLGDCLSQVFESDGVGAIEGTSRRTKRRLPDGAIDKLGTTTTQASNFDAPTETIHFTDHRKTLNLSENVPQ
jgi:hypothetical protein